MITLDRLNRKEAIRYLGGAGISLNYRMDVLMDECEKEITENRQSRDFSMLNAKLRLTIFYSAMI